MSRTTLQGVGLADGVAQGKALICHEAVSVARIDVLTGILHEPGHPLDGVPVKGKVLVFPQGKGSSSGSYILMNLAEQGTSPEAIVIGKPDTILVAGAILAKIPLIGEIRQEDILFIPDGSLLHINGATGVITRL